MVIQHKARKCKNILASFDLCVVCFALEQSKQRSRPKKRTELLFMFHLSERRAQQSH